MPKCSPGKKRKKETYKEGTSKQSKKAKRTKNQQECEKEVGKLKADLKDESVENDLGDSKEDACAEQELDIDKELDRNASKSNLSVFNVKSIIHHVLSDDRVIEMVRKAENEDNDDEDDSDGEIASVIPSIIEPKLTRSRVREVAETTGIAPDPLLLVKETIIQSPLKNVVSPFKLKRKTPEKLNTPGKLDGSERIDDEQDAIPEIEVPLADISFSEGGSSDEEYDPFKELWDGSEDDSESCVSNTSDLASPEPLRRTSRAKRRLLTDPVSSPQPEDLLKNDEEASLNTAKRSRNRRHFNFPVKIWKISSLVKIWKISYCKEEEISSPFKVPFPLLKSGDMKESAKTDLIATRTRSRLPLTDTSLQSLEAQFILPDLTPDLYDIINLEDLEQDDIDWHKWLFGLTAEKGSTDTDDPEDSEYNFMADDQKEEKEEYRTDRAVKISQKELTELFEQFLTEFGDEIPMTADIDKFSLESQSTPDKLDHGEEPAMTLQQRQCIIQQLQKHTQLLVQVVVLCKEQPGLNLPAEMCEGLIQDMVRLNDVANSNFVARLVDNKDTALTVFSCVGLNEALRVINLPRSSDRSVASPSAQKPGYESRETTPVPPIPEEVAMILKSSPVFIYTGLLPRVAFHTQKTGGRADKFLQCEDNLLVLGIDQYGHDWSELKKHYLPVKTLNQIKIRRKNLCSNRAQDNVVKQYRKTGKIPNLPTIPAMPVTEERHRPILLDSISVSTGPIWCKKLSEQQAAQNCSGKKVYRKRKTVKSSFTQEIQTIVLKDPMATHDADSTKDALINSQPLLPEGSKNQFRTISTGHSITARTDKSVATEKIRTILPNLTPSPKEPRKAPTPSPQPLINEPLDRGSPIDIPGVPKDQSTILQDSEKENVQPLSEVPQVDNVDEVNLENMPADTSDNTKVRAISFAHFYLNNVKKVIREDSHTYQAFLKVLVDSKSNGWGPAKLYEKIAVVLKDFPDLVSEFIGFLEPHQAVDAGVFMTNNEILKARTFLERVENHFQKNPSHFQKIIKAFSTFNLNESKWSQLYDSVIPLLKGQQYLIEEFNSFFNNLKPQPSHHDDFEEVELGSGSEIEVDDFEEVIIPDVKKTWIKPREFGKTPLKHTNRNKKCRKMKKDEASDKNVSENVLDYDDKECDEDITEDNVLEGVNEDIEDNCGKALESDEEDEESMEKINSDSENRDISSCYNDAILTKYTSDMSNPSSPASECKSGDNDDPFDEDYIESPGTTHDSQVTSASEAASDLSNEALDVPASSNISPSSVEQNENLETADSLEKHPQRDVYKEKQVISSPEVAECNSEEKTHSSANVAKELCVEQSEIMGECSNDLRISANNLEVDQNGKPVVVWTREDDRKILQLCQTRGISDNIYQDISQELGNKTAPQVESRFRLLVSLLPGDNNGNSSSDQSGSDSGEESCDETEEN